MKRVDLRQVARAVIAMGLATVVVVCSAAGQRAAIFEFTLLAAFSPVAGAQRDDLRPAIQGGARQLAGRSGLADPNGASKWGSVFFEAYRDSNGHFTVAFAGAPLEEASDVDKLYGANVERVRWGIDSGQLKPSSRGMSGFFIDGVPCALQDGDHRSGANMRTSICFVPGAQRAQFSV